MRSGTGRALAVAGAIWFAVAACQVAPTPSAGAQGPAAVQPESIAVGGVSYRRVVPETLAGMLAREDLTLVNVHIPYDGEIEPTDAFIPFDQIGAREAELPARDQRIVLYCLTGRMSAIAAETLVKAGYTDVWDLAGGMDAWTAAGLPLVRTPPG